MHHCNIPIVSPLGVTSQIEHLDFAANPKGHQIQTSQSRWIDGHMIACSHRDKLLLLVPASLSKLRRLRPHGCLLKDELLYCFGKSQCFHFFLSHLAFWSLLSGFTPIFGLLSRGFLVFYYN